MPRDLEEERRQTLAGMPPLVKSPPSLDHEDALDEHRHGRDPNDLHPITGTLNPSYLDSCVALENATFPPNERGDEAKVRLYNCFPWFLVGIFFHCFHLFLISVPHLLHVT